MNKLLSGVLAFGLVISGAVDASTLGKDKQDKELYQITEKDIAASPELSDENLKRAASTSASMRCLVDTPAWDRWGSPRCWSVGAARTATAFFSIQNTPTNYEIIWSDSRCSSNSKSCALPIFNYQSITVSATVKNTANNTYVDVQATAHYEGLD